MNLKQLVINTGSQFVGRAVSIAITLLTTILLRRYLGRSVYGMYIYLSNIVLIGVAMADMGTYLTSVRESQSAFRGSAKVLGESVLLRGLLGICGGLIVLLLQPFVPGSLHPIFILSSLALLLNLTIVKESLAMVFHACEKLYFSSLIQSGVSLINLIVVLGVIYFHQPLEGVFWGNVLGLIILTGPLLVYVSKNQLLTMSFDVLPIRQLLIKSLPLGGVLFLFTIYSRLDSFMINYYFGPAAVGIYGVAYKIYDNLALPAAFILNSLLPQMSRMVGVQTSALKVLCKKTLWFLTGLSLLLIIFIYFTAPWIIAVLTGEKGFGEITVLRLLSVATLFAYANHVTGYVVIALGLQKKSLVIAVIALLFNGLSNVVLLPYFGIYICAILTIATEALVLVLSAAVVINYLNKQEKLDPSLKPYDY